jgi:hypothetical protein
MVAAGMRDTRLRAAALAVAAAVFAGAGCGGGERQDADAPSGEFGLEVVRATFPAEQRIAEDATLRLEVENTGDRAVPDVAVTVETAAVDGQAPVAFGQADGDATLASSARPVWVLDEGPKGGESAYTNTWNVGALDEGESTTVEWKVTAVKAGSYTLAWRLAPALEGDVSLAEGRTEGEFEVTIADEPVPARVGEDGEVVRGEEAGR